MINFTQIASENDRLDYRDRQLRANQLGCDAYVEFHYNAKEVDYPGITDNPATILVANNSSQRTRNIAARILDQVCQALGLEDGGVKVLEPGEAGYWNLYYASGNSMLLELLWVSDSEQAALADDEEVQRILAGCICTGLEAFDVEHCGLSLGHKFKESNPGDKGAPVFGREYSECAEADLAEALMHTVMEWEKMDSGIETQLKNMQEAMDGVNRSWLDLIQNITL